MEAIIEKINKLSKSDEAFYCMPTKDLMQLGKACDNQYLKITLNKYKIVYVYVEVIKFVNNISFIINGPLVIFVNIDTEEIRVTYDLYDTITILFSDHPFIEILTKKDFMNQINYIKNSYINF